MGNPATTKIKDVLAERVRLHINQHATPAGCHVDAARAFSVGFFGEPLTAPRQANEDADATYRAIVEPAHAAGGALWTEMCDALPRGDIEALAHFDPMGSVHSLFERNWANTMEEDLRLLAYHGGSCDGSRSYRITEAGRSLVARRSVAKPEGAQ